MNEGQGRGRGTGGTRDTKGTKRKELETRGEAAAVAYLERQGYRIAGVHWQCPAGQVDIIAWEGLDLVLVDVETRRTAKKDAVAKPVSEAKKRRLKRIATLWVIEHGVCPRQLRFDVITLLVITEDRALLRHLRGEDLVQP
jgi:putative endonuclease